MYHTGLADTYRNEQYLPRADYFYDLERKLIAVNFNNPDKTVVAKNLLTWLRADYENIINFFQEFSR
jgi:hypothetical protein